MTGVPLQPDPSAPARNDDLKFRGLLHDLGHQMMTLSLLAEAVSNDSALSAGSRERMDLVMQEMYRIVDVITDSTAAEPSIRRGSQSVVDVRALAQDVTKLAQLAYETTVIVRPGPAARLRINGIVLWRVLVNLVDNAVRAAGPRGTVEITIEQELDTIIEITDNGPGPSDGPSGTCGLGIAVAWQLLEAEGGRLELTGSPGGGTLARVVFSLAREYQLTPALTGTWH